MFSFKIFTSSFLVLGVKTFLDFNILLFCNKTKFILVAPMSTPNLGIKFTALNFILVFGQSIPEQKRRIPCFRCPSICTLKPLKPFLPLPRPNPLRNQPCSICSRKSRSEFPRRCTLKKHPGFYPYPYYLQKVFYPETWQPLFPESAFPIGSAGRMRSQNNIPTP